MWESKKRKWKTWLKERYNLEYVNNDDMVEVYETIGRRIGAVISGGEIDYDRVSKTILEDIKNDLTSSKNKKSNLANLIKAK